VKKNTIHHQKLPLPSIPTKDGSVIEGTYANVQGNDHYRTKEKTPSMKSYRLNGAARG
jgi:hypothetical protein